MTSSAADLFVELSYRLKNMRNVAVLMHLLEWRADECELKTTLPSIALHALRDLVSYKEVRKAVDDLVALGLVKTRVHANTRTHFTVDRGALLSLLSEPLPDVLPGVRQDSFPFLEAWRVQRASESSLTPAPEALAPTTEVSFGEA